MDKQRWFRDRLSKSQIQRIMFWGQTLAKGQTIEWGKRDSDIFAYLTILIQDFHHEQYLERKGRNVE